MMPLALHVWQSYFFANAYDVFTAILKQSTPLNILHLQAIFFLQIFDPLCIPSLVVTFGFSKCL